VPRTSDSCARVCEILLLYELLKRRRPDLNLERGVNLLSLVGRRGRKALPSPAKSPSRELIKEGLKVGREAGLKLREPLDVVAAALELSPEVFPSFGVSHELTEAAVAEGIEDILGGTVKRDFPSPALAEPSEISFWRKRMRDIVKGFNILRSDDRAQDLACAIALPFAIKAITVPHPLVKAGAALTLLGCGVEFIDRNPRNIRGLPLGIGPETRTPQGRLIGGVD